MRRHDGNAVINDYSLWFKHIEDRSICSRLEKLDDDEEIVLIADKVVGRWRRMLQGDNPRPTEGIKPIGQMKEIWGDWFKTRRGERILIQVPETVGDDFLAAGSELFSEWSDELDEEAFRDL